MYKLKVLHLVTLIQAYAEMTFCLFEGFKKAYYRLTHFFYSRLSMPGYRLALLFNNTNTNARPETNNTRDTNKDR